MLYTRERDVLHMVGRVRVMREISEMKLGREIERRVKWLIELGLNQ